MVRNWLVLVSESGMVMGFCVCFVDSICYHCKCCSRVDAGVLHGLFKVGISGFDV